MSATVCRLMKAHELAWAALKPAFALAIIQARQADYEAARAATLAQCSVPAVYPPLVIALAESVVGADQSPWGDCAPPPPPGDFECCASGSCEVCKR